MRHARTRSIQSRLAVADLALAGATAALAPLTTPEPRGALAASAQAGAPAANAQPAARFIETFTGKPPAPEPWRPADWDVTHHMRDRDHWIAPLPVAAHHGADCSAAPATHAAYDVDQAAYLCNDHMMTTIDGGSYGLIYLTPNHMVDFSAGEAVISFDMSTFRSSPRDWVDLWISPYDDHVQLPLQEWLPDLSGEPRNSVHLALSLGGGFFQGALVRDFGVQDLPLNTDRGYERVLSPSAVRRDSFELRISRTSLKFGMPQYDLWWVDTTFADLGWDRGVVQFGHHSYTPDKCDGVCGPNTWHWDNMAIEPAVPFAMLKADRR